MHMGMLPPVPAVAGLNQEKSAGWQRTAYVVHHITYTTLHRSFTISTKHRAYLEAPHLSQGLPIRAVEKNNLLCCIFLWRFLPLLLQGSCKSLFYPAVLSLRNCPAVSFLLNSYHKISSGCLCLQDAMISYSER
jgi:hypothetical protein